MAIFAHQQGIPCHSARSQAKLISRQKILFLWFCGFGGCSLDSVSIDHVALMWAVSYKYQVT